MFIIDCERNLVKEKDVTPEMRKENMLHKFVAEGDNLKVYFMHPDGEDRPVMMWNKKLVDSERDAIMLLWLTAEMTGLDAPRVEFIEVLLIPCVMYAVKVMKLGKDPNPEKTAWDTIDAKEAFALLLLSALVANG